MRIRAVHDRIEIHVPAKLNLFLEVHGKRGDGFHQLETVMAKVGLFDTITFRSIDEPEITLKVRNASRASNGAEDIPTDHRNLLWRAVERVRTKFGIERGALVELVKRIPAQAGLGGGSADAAAGLVAANLGWRIGATHAELSDLAAELGSDVPFFLHGSPALCQGRGERVTPYAGNGIPSHFVIAKPDEGFSTAEVYAALNIPHTPRPVPRTLHAGSIFNRLETAANSLSDTCRRLKSDMQGAGLSGAMMTGSGSAVFGVCRSARQALRTMHLLRARGWSMSYAVASIRDRSRIPSAHV